ncbi:hypothetical protein Q0M94_06345 [Deinococcus radiomollis]|uniref:hypothetical protein n=1 Tax=Deinococcus radiomollis TaxID=468916 RepID=UPI0038927ACA
MPTIRNRRSDPFTAIPNSTARNSRLSLQAKGLLTVMLSRHDDWTYHLREIQKHSTNGRDATRAAFRELEAAGYVQRHPVRIKATGQLKGWEFIVSDLPTFPALGEAVSLETRATAKPLDGKPVTTKKETAIKKEKTNTKPAPAGGRATQDEDETPAGKEESAGRAAALLLLGVWNEHRGRLPEARQTERRLKILDRISADFGPAAEATIRAATLEVAADEFWQKRRYGFDNLLADDKFVGKAEAWFARSGPPSAVQDIILNEDVTEDLF